jgi:hypothetical protein
MVRPRPGCRRRATRDEVTSRERPVDDVPDGSAMVTGDDAGWRGRDGVRAHVARIERWAEAEPRIVADAYGFQLDPSVDDGIRSWIADRLDGR